MKRRTRKPYQSTYDLPSVPKPRSFEAFLITLERTPERTAAALRNLAPLGLPLTIIWGSDCQCPHETAWLPVDPDTKYQPGELSLVGSWRKALAQVLRRRCDWAIIFEDDAEPERDGVLEALSCLPDGADFVMLHDHHRPQPVWLPERCGAFGRVSVPGWQSHAVAVTQAGARRLLRALAIIDQPIDQVLRSLPDCVIWQCLEGRGFFRQSFWSHSLVRAGDCQTIPKRLHQIWIGGPMPAEWAAYCQRWRELHPAWEYRLWDDASLAAEFPEARPETWGPTMAARCDMWRLLVLERFGGLYADVDYEPFRAFDKPIGAGSFVASIVNGQVQNGMLACSPGHRWIRDGLAQALAGAAAGLPILDAAGPNMWTRVLAQPLEHFQKPLMDGPHCVGHAHGETGLVMLAEATLYPYLWYQPRPATYPETAWAAHHWARSWWTPADWGY